MEKCHLQDLVTPSLRVHKPHKINLSLVSKSKVILFGGATGDTGKYIITGDTYGLDLISYKWIKLEGTHFKVYKMYRIWNSTIPKSRSWKLCCGFIANGGLWRSHWR